MQNPFPAQLPFGLSRENPGKEPQTPFVRDVGVNIVTRDTGSYRGKLRRGRFSRPLLTGNVVGRALGQGPS